MVTHDIAGACRTSLNEVSTGSLVLIWLIWLLSFSSPKLGDSPVGQHILIMAGSISQAHRPSSVFFPHAHRNAYVAALR